MTPAVPIARGENPAAPAARRYRVFLSYSHVDTKWARWLMRRLDGYRVPPRFHGRVAPIGTVGARIAPVFRDRDELPTASDLGETIRAALRQAATLVVICSPAAAKSRWVNEEILAFKRLGGEARVFAFIVGGEPKTAGAAEDCFPPALRATLGADGELSATPAEVIAADARPAGDGPRLAFLRLAAGLIGVGFDELRQREQARRLRRMTLIAGGSLAGMAMTLALAVAAWQARDDAQRRQAQAEDVLTFMLGNFRDELKKIGRLSLLDAVGDKATAYFDSLDVRDVTDTALTRQTAALIQIGENRLDQARYPEALKTFAAAHERAAALVGRSPANRDAWFERGRSEYWMAFANYNRRELAAANDWFARYRATATSLLALDRADPRSRHELVYAEQALAALKVEMGDYAGARPGLLAGREILVQMLAAKPGDFQLRYEISVADSWLGVVAERLGRYDEARECFGRRAAALELLMRDDSGTARWRAIGAESYLHVGLVSGLVGRREEAARALQKARETIEPIAIKDPHNRDWASRVSQLRVMQAAVAFAAGEVTAVAALLAPAREQLEAVVAVEPSSRFYAEQLARAWTLEADTRLALGRADASEAASRAIGLVEPLVKEDGVGDRGLRSALAEAHLAAGRVAFSRSDRASAVRHWQRVADLVASRAVASNDWRLLDPAARALARLGRSDESRALIERLGSFGYHPMRPWETKP